MDEHTCNSDSLQILLYFVSKTPNQQKVRCKTVFLIQKYLHRQNIVDVTRKYLNTPRQFYETCRQQKCISLLEGINFLSMVSEMNVLNDIFYKKEMFKPKYNWVEIKYLDAIQYPRQQLFADVIMLFLYKRLHLPLQLPHVDVNQNGFNKIKPCSFFT